jgi:exodeoxyribonuclease VII small subunit
MVMVKKTVPKKSAAESDLSFEDALSRLEDIVTKLEGGDAPLDSALKLYEEGVRLSRACARQLKEAERRVEILEDKGGELTGRPFGDQACAQDAAEDPEDHEAEDEGEDDDEDENGEDSGEENQAAKDGRLF